MGSPKRGGAAPPRLPLVLWGPGDAGDPKAAAAAAAASLVGPGFGPVHVAHVPPAAALPPGWRRLPVGDAETPAQIAARVGRPVVFAPLGTRFAADAAAVIGAAAATASVVSWEFGGQAGDRVAAGLPAFVYAIGAAPDGPPRHLPARLSA